MRRVVEDVLRARAGGDALPDAEVIARHPELSPELKEELAILGVIERARSRAVGDGSVSGRPATPGAVLESFDGYDLLREASRGGQGVVYEAVQRSTGRRVAIKVMREGLFGGARDAERLEREVRILGQIDHPGVVGVLASGVRAGHFYSVMEWVDGVPIDVYAAGVRGGQGWTRALVRTFLALCEAVGAAHVRGIIHRDLKPANVLVDGRGSPRVLDFGLARLSADWSASRGMTAKGDFVGSMPWASPEQASGDPSRIDVRTDVYALGVVLYQMLSGRFPYRVEGPPREVLGEITGREPARLRPWGVDEELEAICLKCLAKEPGRRYQGASELAEDLRRYLDGRVVVARPPSAAYQIRAFARRNRALVASAAAGVAAITLGLAAASLGLIEASAGRRAAEAARDEARRAAATAVASAEDAERATYLACVSAAQAALRSEDAAAARERLEAAPERLRDWEWRHLRARVDASAARLELPPARGLAVSPDGRRIATIGPDGSVRVVDAATRRVTWEAPGPPDPGRSTDQRLASFSPDGTMVVSTEGPTVRVWTIGQPRPTRELRFEPEGLWGYVSASFSPGQDLLVAAGREGRTRAWAWPSGEEVPLPEAMAMGDAVDWSPDGRALLLVNSGVRTAGRPRVFEREGWAERPWVWPADRPKTLGTGRFSPDGSRVAVAMGPDVFVSAVDGLLGEHVLRGGSQQVFVVAWSPDGALVAAGGADRLVRVWDASGGGLVASLRGHEGAVIALGFLGARTLASAAEDGSVRVWDAMGPSDPAVMTLRSVPAPALALSGATGAERVVAGSMGTGLWTVDPRRDEATPLIEGEPRLVASSLSGRVLVVDQPPMVRVLDAEGSERGAIRTDGAGVLLAAVDEGGSRVATLDLNRVRVWDAGSGRELLATPSMGGASRAVSLSPDGVLLVVAGPTLRVVRVEGGAEVARIREPEAEAAFLSTRFDQRGRLLAAGTSGGEVLVFEVASWRVVSRLAGMQPGVWSLAFNPSGTRLAAGSKDRAVHLWDWRHGQRLLTLRGHTGTVMRLAWSADGLGLASSSFYDGTIRLWLAPGPR